MKKLVYIILFLSCSVSAWSQAADTLYTRSKQKIACKIVEINDVEVKYRLAAAPDGPMYVLSREKVMRYTLSSGLSEVLVLDELSIESQHASIINNRTVVKVHPFSFVNSQISLGYEKVLKVGMNLDIEAGYMNSNINYNYPLGQSGYGYGRSFYSGAYVKPGMKFFIGQDFSLKGMRYAHPLKGRYIKLDLAASFINTNDVQMWVYPQNNYPNNPTPAQFVKTDVKTFAYGAFVNYGRQFILGNILTLEYYVGVGFTAVSTSFSNPDFQNQTGYNEFYTTSNFHGFMRTPGLGLSGTAGFRIGYILPEKKPKEKAAN